MAITLPFKIVKEHSPILHEKKALFFGNIYPDVFGAKGCVVCSLLSNDSEKNNMKRMMKQTGQNGSSW